MNRAEQIAPMQLKPIIAAALATAVAWVFSHLPAIKDWLQVLVLLASLVAWLLVIALRLRAWFKNKSDSDA